MEYGNRENNQLGPELCAFYEKTWLMQSSQKAIFDRFFTNTKTLPQNNTEDIIFRKWLDPSQLYFGAENVNETLVGNDTAAGERTVVTAPKDAYKKFILPEGSSGDSKQTMKYVEQTATVFPIGDWMPETEEINLLHPVYTTTEAVKQMGQLGGTIIDSYYRDQLSYGAGHLDDITGNDVTTAAFTAACENMSLMLELSGAEMVNDIMSSSTDVGTVPVENFYLGVVHPMVAMQLRKNADFVELKDYAAGLTPLEGEIGIIGLVRFVKNPNAYISYVSAGNYSAEVIIMGKDHSSHVALRGKNRTEVIFQAMGSGGIADPLKRKGTLGWKTWLGAKTLYAERLGKITVDVAYA